MSNYSLFRRESNDAKRDAQRNLASRTHYVDDDTLRYFRARILSSYIVDQGRLYAIVESSSGDYEHKTRIFRYAIFDLFGTVVERPDISHSWKSSAAATKAMWTALDKLDARQITLDAIERHREAFDRDMEELTRKVDAIDQKAA